MNVGHHFTLRLDLTEDEARTLLEVVAKTPHTNGLGRIYGELGSMVYQDDGLDPIGLDLSELPDPMNWEHRGRWPWSRRGN